MEAMTMIYSTDDPSVAAKVKTGDQITATVYDGDLVLHRIRLAKPPIVPQPPHASRAVLTPSR